MTRFSDSLRAPRMFTPKAKHVVGVFTGEGVGPEIVPVTVELLEMLRDASDRDIEIRTGGLIGYEAEAAHGASLTDESIRFAEEIFAQNGTLFCGPGGGRFVYELRRVFDLFCKFTPIEPLPELRAAGVVREAATAATNIVVVRENSGGIYQGEWGQEGTVAWHSFGYEEAAVRRIIDVALNLAEARRGRLHTVLKPGGVPSVTKLWRGVAEELAKGRGVEVIEHEVDNAAYQIVANPAQYDVIVTPNLFGDVIGDCGSLLLASRGLSYSGNFNAQGNGVYQTAHGAARDIAGKGVANPSAQILSLGMMLRESFDWEQADQWLRNALRATYRQGLCTADVAMPGHRIVDTEEFGNAVKRHLAAILEGKAHENRAAAG